MEGPEYQDVIAQVNARLGFRGSNQLSADEVLAVWEVCRFEKNSDLTLPSPMCAAFSVANNQILEYQPDLDYYYRTGYGVPNRRLVENINCELMQDMLRFLQSNNPNEPTARIYGTHSQNLHLFFVTLGIFEDLDPLTRHNIAQQINRQWRTSWITPKGGNMAVVRYE